MSYLKRRIKSFSYALKGAGFLIRSQPHTRIHLLATIVVVALGTDCHLNRTEWCLLIIAIMTVWIAEGMNTALETLADAVCPHRNPLVGRAKDVAAAAVLIAATGAVLIGILVFGDRIKL